MYVACAIVASLPIDFQGFVESGRLPLAVPSAVRGVCITADILYLIDSVVWIAAWRQDLLQEAAAHSQEEDAREPIKHHKSIAAVAPAPEAEGPEGMEAATADIEPATSSTSA